MGRALLSIAWVAALSACASATPDAEDAPVGPRLLEVVAPAPIGDALPIDPPPVDREATFLAPNSKDADGTGAYVHYTSDDMPLRINVDLPRQSARYASREQTREAVLAGMRLWARAIQRAYPWFAMEFVEGDPAAPVQIRWRRRIPGPWAGFGGIGWSVRDGELEVHSSLEYTTQTCPAVECTLRADELRLLVAHEFGHALGLGHCLDCDSAMNYAWHTRDRILVTDQDVMTFRALTEVRNGTRVDGSPLQSLRTED